MIDLPRGFRACGVHAGLKKDGQLDVGMLVSDSPCRGAAVFTKNLVVAAPVVFDRQLLLDHPESLAGVVLNSKNANAVTGEQGMRDAEAMSAYAQRALATANRMLVMSTGVIGNPMPMDKIRAGIDLGVPALGPDGTGLSLAMMTTDTRPKTATATLSNGARLTGFAKGAGMIHPDMATMLSIVATDAELSLTELRSLVAWVSEHSFNCISVDGDTSTNDTFLVLANGRAGPVDPSEFRAALLSLSQDLARQVAFDGEGAAHHLTIEVEGLADFAQARAIGRTIATSPLVKTAIYGRDANWGRILAAAGRAGVPFDPELANLWLEDLQFLSAGQPKLHDPDVERDRLSRQALTIRLQLGSGPGRATVWTCDLTDDYIRINAEYRT